LSIDWQSSFLLNATIEEIDGFDDVFRNMEDIVVREINSFKYLQMKNIHCRLYLDDFINADFSEKTSINYHEKIIITDWHPSTEILNIPIINKLNNLDTIFSPMYYENAYNDWQSIIENYGTSSLCITSRYHSVYSAGLAGIPFVCLPVNSHKILGLIKYSKLPIPICNKSSHINSMIKYAKNNESLYSEFQSFLKENIGDTSFYEIDNYLNIDSFIDESIAIEQSIEAIKKFRSKGLKFFSQNLKKELLHSSQNRIVLEQNLIENFQYEEWLLRNENKRFLDRSFQYIYNKAICYYAIGNFYLAEKYLLSIKTSNVKLIEKVLSKLYGELGKVEYQEDLFNSSTWNDSEYLYYLQNKMYKEAWMMMKKRPYSKNLIEKGKHYHYTKNNSEIFIILEGGIGDQVRHCILFDKIKNNFLNVTIGCDKRLHSLLKRNFPYFSYDIPSNEDNYNNICPIMELYETLFSNKNVTKTLIKADSLLYQYWFKQIKEMSGKKKIIGICQGTHIKSYERVSNIFDYELWDDFLKKHSKECCFINLSFEIKNECSANIINFPVDLKNDMESLCAIISCCNLVITPPNTILDITGALNIRTYALSVGQKFKYRQVNECNDLFFNSSIKWINIDNPSLKSDIFDKISFSD